MLQSCMYVENGATSFFNCPVSPLLAYPFLIAWVLNWLISPHYSPLQHY